MHGTQFDFEQYLASRKRSIESTLERVLPDEGSDRGPDRPAARTVLSAMRYAALGPGKRLRAVVTLAAYEACGGTADAAEVPAAAMELIHTYSLVHDDLPAMDDDDLRRGRPTVHRVYGEAAAILSGDALLTLALELLATCPIGLENVERRNQAVTVAATRSGVGGLIGGQLADLEADCRFADPARLDWIHLHKTGALFAACAEIGGIHAGATEPQREALARYGETLGLVFQIADDLLDRSGSAETLGKTPGKDLRSDKTTYPALHGPLASRRRAEQLAHEAQQVLRSKNLLTEPLGHLAELFVTRTS